MNEKDFGTWLLRQIERREWNQAEFARRTGFSGAAVSDWISGKRIPEPQSIDVISDILGADRDMLLDMVGHRSALELLSPDDPATALIALVKRVQWTDDRLAGIEAVLLAYLKRDHQTTKQPAVADLLDMKGQQKLNNLLERRRKRASGE